MDANENVLRELGRALRWNSALPKGANVNFVEVIGNDEVCERTFERGVEEFTYACGTEQAVRQQFLHILERFPEIM